MHAALERPRDAKRGPGAADGASVENEADGMPTKVKSFDWIFIKAKLALACTAFPTFTELLPGDVIERQSDTKRFTVQPVAAGRPVHEPHDAHGVMIVTHSQEC